MPGIQLWEIHRPDPHESVSSSAFQSVALTGTSYPAAPIRTSVLHPAAIASAGLEDQWTQVETAPVHQDRKARAERLPADRFAAETSHGSAGSPSPSYARLKRGFDVLAAVLLALVILPLIPVIALAIRIDSPGTVFYKQDRVGQHGRIFRIYKFRTMRSDAERHGAVWAAEDDPRVTRTGTFMRRARIDELPQLLNVVRGEMTFVGPRPERPEFTSLLERELPGYRQRQLAKPGLTGWAQIRYQYASSIQDTGTKLEFDLYYVRHRSILFDIRILLQTIPVVFHLQGR